MRWLITNRNFTEPDGFGCDLDKLSYWMADPAADPKPDLMKRSGWTAVSADEFKAALVRIASTFPSAIGTPVADEKHVCLFVRTSTPCRAGCTT